MTRSFVVACTMGLSLFALTPLASAETKYVAGERHSPMTAEIVARLHDVIERGHHRTDVFSKIGDSITATPHFLSCFASPRETDLASHDGLAQTLTFFSHDQADDSHLSWNRISKSAFVGWSTFGALGSKIHSPVHDELRATDAAFAVVMYGTNETYGGGVPNFEHNLRRLVNEILDDGVVPLLSTFPPRRDNASLDGVAREMNEAARAVAESERVPLMDLHAVLVDLPGFGLGPDGIHPRALEGHPCSLTDDALKNGMNARNLLTLEALDRARRFLVEGAAPDADR